MSGAAFVAWTLVALSLMLAVLGLRAWRTLKEGEDFQTRLAGLPDDALHAFLDAPRGSQPEQPADILYRLNALMEFERRNDPRLIPLYIRLLEDPHPSIVAICRETLRERTGEDFPHPENDTLQDPAAWRAWWAQKAG